MTPARARALTKRRIQKYLELYDTAHALEIMRQDASEYIFWILQLQKGRKFEVIQGGKDECDSIAFGPCVVSATGDV